MDRELQKNFKIEQSLFRYQSIELIYQNLIKFFDHPGILLFRGRELAAINEYCGKYPLRIEKRVLDLGCGEGYIGNMLFNKIDVGLDVIHKEAEKAKKFPVYKKIVVTDAKKMSFKNSSFDVIFSNSVIEHIEGIDQVLSEVSRVLCPQGLFIFTVPSRKFSDYLYFTTLFRRIGLSFIGNTYSKLRNKQLNHFNLFDDLEWEKRLKEVSLNIIYRKYYLTPQEIKEWDKMSIFLRLTTCFSFFYRRFKQKFYKRVEQIFNGKQNLDVGGGLLFITRKIACQ